MGISFGFEDHWHQLARGVLQDTEDPDDGDSDALSVISSLPGMLIALAGMNSGMILGRGLPHHNVGKGKSK
jgi:hypothetical protein